MMITPPVKAEHTTHQKHYLFALFADSHGYAYRQTEALYRLKMNASVMLNVDPSTYEFGKETVVHKRTYSVPENVGTVYTRSRDAGDTACGTRTIANEFAGITYPRTKTRNYNIGKDEILFCPLNILSARDDVIRDKTDFSLSHIDKIPYLSYGTLSHPTVEQSTRQEQFQEWLVDKQCSYHSFPLAQSTVTTEKMYSKDTLLNIAYLHDWDTYLPPYANRCRKHPRIARKAKTVKNECVECLHSSPHYKALESLSVASDHSVNRSTRKREEEIQIPIKSYDDGFNIYRQALNAMERAANKDDWMLYVFGRAAKPSPDTFLSRKEVLEVNASGMIDEMHHGRYFVDKDGDMIHLSSSKSLELYFSERSPDFESGTLEFRIRYLQMLDMYIIKEAKYECASSAEIIVPSLVDKITQKSSLRDKKNLVRALSSHTVHPDFSYLLYTFQMCRKMFGVNKAFEKLLAFQILSWKTITVEVAPYIRATNNINVDFDVLKKYSTKRNHKQHGHDLFFHPYLMIQMKMFKSVPLIIASELRTKRGAEKIGSEFYIEDNKSRGSRTVRRTKDGTVEYSVSFENVEPITVVPASLWKEEDYCVPIF